MTLKAVLPRLMHLLQAVLELLSSLTFFVFQLERALLKALDLHVEANNDAEVVEKG